MKPTTKMVWLIVLIVIGAALFFVILDDEDTRSAPLSTTAIDARFF